MSYRYFAKLQKTARRGKKGKDDKSDGRVRTGSDKMMKLLPANKFMFWEASKRLHSLTFLNRCSRFTAKNLKVVTNEKGEAVGDVLTIIC